MDLAVSMNSIRDLMINRRSLTVFNTALGFACKFGNAQLASLF